MATSRLADVYSGERAVVWTITNNNYTHIHYYYYYYYYYNYHYYYYYYYYIYYFSYFIENWSSCYLEVDLYPCLSFFVQGRLGVLRITGNVPTVNAFSPSGNVTLSQTVQTARMKEIVVSFF